LQNIYKEIERTHDKFQYCSANLSQWAEQGVLLLNTCLTVNEGSPDSHKGIWSPFIKKIIQHICTINPKVLFVLWGSKAQEVGSQIIPDGKKRLISGHPSPLNRKNDFIGNNHFILINEYLSSIGESKIDWSIYPTN